MSQVKPTSSFEMIRTLGLVSMLSGFLIVLVYQLTKPAIAENKRKAIERAVFQVIPNSITRKNFILTADKIIPIKEDLKVENGIKIYAGYDENGKLQGIATEAAARGYQDVIRILYGYNYECQCITGTYVLKSTETPGLGDKIYKDKEFLKNFIALDAKLDISGTALENPIVTVKHGDKKHAWEIDSISGATISSKAMGKMLNESTQIMAPLLVKNIKSIQELKQ
jgi:electron transport complex protein RnfG